MRPHKRATLIAKSIRKLIEDSGGSSPDLALVQVQLPAHVFDLTAEDGGSLGATEIRVDGVMFKKRWHRFESRAEEIQLIELGASMSNRVPGLNAPGRSAASPIGSGVPARSSAISRTRARRSAFWNKIAAASSSSCGSPGDRARRMGAIADVIARSI
jgi:hypothetical protein